MNLSNKNFSIEYLNYYEKKIIIFCSNVNNYNKSLFETDIKQFTRNIKLRSFFKKESTQENNFSDSNTDNSQEFFIRKKNSTWEPYNIHRTVNTFIEPFKNEQNKETRRCNNLAKHEQKALEELKTIDIQKLEEVKDKTEYYYRYARVYHKQGKYLQAVEYYSVTIENGKKIPHYFAANSALQIGNLYRDFLDDSEKAKKYYKKVFTFPSHEYKSELDMEANYGLHSLKE